MSSSLAGKTLLNQYKVEEFITSTPLGELYRATDERRGKPIALTLLAKSIEAVKQLEAKAGRLQSISHPHLAKYIGFQQTPTLAFLIEEWADGPSLKDIRRGNTIGAEEALFYAKSACAALDALHKKDFLHLHLAPELIRIDQRGEVVVCGIGNAHPIGEEAPRRLNRYPLLYASPEQIQNQPLNPAADIYALAVILYEILTGTWINGRQPPKTSDAIRKAHIEGTPPPPRSLNKRLPDHFPRMILWALRKDP
ncbi:MAG TPA: serine/threonine-protein kinase, partial [Anaerolineales bacterium]|nr:serine/threonine-protein kinase [Anaerolineales bacterium]